MKHFVSICCLIFLSINLFGQVESDLIVADYYKTKNFEAAIFPATYIDFIPGKSRFTPTKQEVDKAEFELRTKLKEINTFRENQSHSPIIHKQLRKYRRQYFGYFDENGHKILLINCFWKKDKYFKQKWLKSWIQVNDGGSYYWNIKFDLNTGKLFDLQVNGYA